MGLVTANERCKRCICENLLHFFSIHTNAQLADSRLYFYFHLPSFNLTISFCSFFFGLSNLHFRNAFAVTSAGAPPKPRWPFLEIKNYAQWIRMVKYWDKWVCLTIYFKISKLSSEKYLTFSLRFFVLF